MVGLLCCQLSLGFSAVKLLGLFVGTLQATGTDVTHLSGKVALALGLQKSGPGTAKCTLLNSLSSLLG
ncbi:MAG: hypothetical protein ACO3QS_07665, partial [Burkholderiaceae bacterium]